ncbi:MAG: MAPEG family protein [Rhizobiaceae bacterium]
MSIELKMLLFTVALFFVQLIVQVVAEVIQHGVGYMASARDDWKNPTGMAGRVERAYFNLLETMPAFAALVLIVLYTGNANANTALGAQIYFWGRVVYFPAYLSGIPFVRTLVWTVSTAGLVLIFWELLKLAL